MKKNLTHLFVTVLLFASLTTTAQAPGASTSWKLTGNSGTNIITNFLGTTDNKPLILRTNNLERMRLSKEGRLGIGTKNPNAKLHVDGGDYVSLSSSGYLQLGSTTGYNMAFDYNVIQSRNNGTANDLFVNYYGGNTYIGSSGLFGVHVAPNGTVGINGTSNSGSALNINANSALNGINVTDPGNNYMFYSVKSGDNAGIFVSKTSTTSYSATIYANNSGKGAGIFAENVSDGFGVTGVSDYGYGVYGLSRYGSYAGFFGGSVYASGTYQGSDEKLKENIKDFTSAMNIINQLHPKLYDFRHDGNYKLMHLPEGNHYGLIAQDVEKVLPNLIKDTKFETRMAKPHISEEDAKNSETINFKALNYTELIPIIIKGMQELNKNLQQEVQEQNQRIDKLEKAIEALSGNSNPSSIKFSSSDNSGAYLKQNAPNPFTQNTIINCNVPSSSKQAQLMIYNQNGSKIKSFDLTNGINNITIGAGTLSSGEYVYSLLIDGKKVDSKKMILTK